MKKYNLDSPDDDDDGLPENPFAGSKRESDRIAGRIYTKLDSAPEKKTSGDIIDKELGKVVFGKGAESGQLLDFVREVLQRKEDPQVAVQQQALLKGKENAPEVLKAGPIQAALRELINEVKRSLRVEEKTPDKTSAKAETPTVIVKHERHPEVQAAPVAPRSEQPKLSVTPTNASDKTETDAGHKASEEWANQLVRKLKTPMPSPVGDGKTSGSIDDVVAALGDARVISAISAAAIAASPASKSGTDQLDKISGQIGDIHKTMQEQHPDQYDRPTGPQVPPNWAPVNQYQAPAGPPKFAPPPPPSGGYNPPPPPSGGQPTPPGPPTPQAPQAPQPGGQPQVPQPERKSSQSGLAISAAIGAFTGGIVGAGLTVARSFTQTAALCDQFGEAVNRAAKGFEQYAPQTQVARAKAEISEIQIEMQRARQLDSKMAQFVNLQTDATKIFEKLKTDIMDYLLTKSLPLLEGGVQYLKLANEQLSQLDQTYWRAAEYVAGFVLNNQELAAFREDVKKKIEKIEENTRKGPEAEPFRDQYMDEFLNMGIPLYAAQPVGRARRPGRGRMNPFNGGGKGPAPAPGVPAAAPPMVL